MKTLQYILFLSLIFSVVSCNLEQEIDIEFPDSEQRYVVECYLEAGRPFNLLLTITSNYFAPFPTNDADFLQSILIDSARVYIRHEGVEYQLDNELYIDFETQQLFNYHANDIVPEDYDSDFELSIILPNGETIEGITRILPAVPLDSVKVEFESDTDTLARVLTYFTDIPNQENYYRRMLHVGTLDSLDQDFAVDDRFVEDSYVFGTAYDFAVGDTVINTIFHLTKDHYEFIQSVENATNANGNPFGQPSPLISNLEGTAPATGIFTGISYSREQTIIER